MGKSEGRRETSDFRTAVEEALYLFFLKKDCLPAYFGDLSKAWAGRCVVVVCVVFGDDVVSSGLCKFR